jgi:molybdopterin converting factor small subunit
MHVRVEFYGIARQRAQRSQLAVELLGQAATVGQVLAEIARIAPDFARECLTHGRLRSELALNLDGERFVSDPGTPISDGQCLLVLSADAGG